MKKIKNKSILQKTIIAIIITLLLSNFIVPTYSHADFGGVLLSPIVDLLCSLGDAVINLLQVAMTGDAPGVTTKWSLSGFLVESGEYYGNDDIHLPATDGTTIEVDSTQFDKGWLGIKDEYYVPVATYSPEQIFAGKVPGLDINFIDPNTDMDGDGAEDKNADGEYLSSAAKLQPTIATWYVALRNLTVVGLLSVLVYVGIRIIISSTASDKAKYKQMLMDWLVALCLVFFLHYIMSFTLTLTQSITEAIAGDGNATVSVEDTGAGESFGTNLLGLARFQTQYKDFGPKMAYLIMYLALVIYTVMFTWFYLKRLLMMAFLTLIAPVVALTYPIDKISDGKAQAFDMWLKEYIFNALIQPFHLIIYTVFVGSAMDLAATNIIYMIAALAFIMPAEKILRKFFGFEKAGAGTLGALAGGLTAASLLGKLGKGKGGGSGKAPGGKPVQEGEKPPRFENKHDINEIEDNNNAKIYEGTYNEEASVEAHKENNEAAKMKYEQEGNQEEADAAQRRIDDANQRLEEIRRNKEETNNKDITKDRKINPVVNWTRTHNINGRSALRLGGRAISGVAKFGTRTAFKAGAGTLAAAVALASGSGLGGASVAFMAGSNLGGRLGDSAVNLGTHVAHGVGRVGGATWNAVGAARRAENGSRLSSARATAADRLLGGTALGRELDLAFGNTRYQDAGSNIEWKKDKNNVQYVRDQIAAQNGGKMPSAEEVRDKMDSFDPYLAEGLTDIKDVLKAQKAESYVSSPKQAAIIAAIGKERGITADILNDDKKAKSQELNLRQDFMNKGYSKAAATKQANYTMNVLKVQNGVAHNLQKIDKSQKPKESKK